MRTYVSLTVAALLTLGSIGCMGPTAKKNLLAVDAPPKAAFSKALLALQEVNATIKNTDEENGIITAEWNFGGILDNPNDPPVQVSIIILDDTSGGKTHLKVSASDAKGMSAEPEIFTKRFLEAYREYVGEVEVEEIKGK